MTESAYRLSPPHNDYWKNLYQSLVPVYGEPSVIQKFFNANSDWAGSVDTGKYLNDYRYKYKKKGFVALIREWILNGKLGDWLEQWLKAVQVKRIERGLKSQAGYEPRIIYNDNELEFHPDTGRIEEYLKNKI